VTPTNLIRAARRLAERLRPAPDALERPEFVTPAIVAFGLSLVLLVAQSWPPSLFFAPALVLACRYYELAHFRPVRSSRLALLLAASVALTGALWALTHRSMGLEQPVTLALAGLTIAMAVHLSTTQRRLAASQAERSLLEALDDEAPLWSCGGLLAIVPVLLLVGFLTGLSSWRSPSILLWGLAAIGVLAAQLRGHRWFPRLAVAWLTCWIGIESVATFAVRGDAGDDALATYCVMATVLGSIATYLLCSSRVRRTFRADLHEAVDPAAATATPATAPRKKTGAVPAWALTKQAPRAPQTLVR